MTFLLSGNKPHQKMVKDNSKDNTKDRSKDNTEDNINNKMKGDINQEEKM